MDRGGRQEAFDQARLSHVEPLRYKLADRISLTDEELGLMRVKPAPLSGMSETGWFPVDPFQLNNRSSVLADAMGKAAELGVRRGGVEDQVSQVSASGLWLLRM